jgi:negative regulator of flagellin synthesis FlgM
MPIVCIEIRRVILMTVDKIGNVNNIFEPKRSKNVQKSDSLSTGNDSVQISSEGLKAIEDARFAQIVRETPDVRAERVQEIKAQIDGGTYNKDLDDKILAMVADKILTGILRK